MSDKETGEPPQETPKEKSKDKPKVKKKVKPAKTKETVDPKVEPESKELEAVPVEELTGSEVTLHIYDVGTSIGIKYLNKALTAVGTGAFHAAVEVNGKEWSYAYCEEGTGIFSCAPTQCQSHTYREAISMKRTQKTEEEIDAGIEQLKAYWHGASYDLLHRNCCTFSDTLCRHLEVGGIPEWVMNLAGAAATVHDACDPIKTKVSAAAVVAAAQAGEVDQKYQISGTVKAKAKDVVKKGKVADEHYKITELATSTTAQFGAALSGFAAKAQEQALELDKQHDLTGQAEKAVKQSKGVLSSMTGWFSGGDKEQASKRNASVFSFGGKKASKDEGAQESTSEAASGMPLLTEKATQ